MTKTRPRLCAGSAFVAAVLIACGQTDDDGGGANGGSNGTLGGGSGGGSAGQSQTSGGRSPTGGQGGTAAGAMASGGVSVGGESGGEDTAGGAGLAGAGGAAECPAIKCAAVCAENWLGLDGCPTCACAPPAAKLSAGSVSCASASLMLAAASSYFIGGIDRWLLDLDWTCSHSGLLGEPARARLQVAIVQPLSPPIDSENRTFFHPRDALEYEVRTATVWLRGSGVPEIEISLIPSSSFLSVRIEKGLLVGGVEYVGSDSTNSSTATLAGPFIVAIPALN